MIYTRIFYLVIFMVMLYIVNTERDQCMTNKKEVEDFDKVNGCGDDYSIINTDQVIENLSKAEATLDAMEIALISVLVLVGIEAMGLCIYIKRRH